MYECWQCGEIFEGKKVNGKVKVYDEYEDSFVSSCPNCGSTDFEKYEED